MTNLYWNEKELKEKGYVSRNWYSHEVDDVTRWFYPVPQSSGSVFSCHKINKLGAESRIQVFASGVIDGVDSKDICLLVDGQPEKDKWFLFTKDVTRDFVFTKFKDWAKDAPLDWKEDAELKLGHLFRETLRTRDVETENKYELQAGTSGVDTKLSHSKKTRLKK